MPAGPIQKIPVSLPPRVLNPSGGPERIDRGKPSQMESEVVKTLKNEIEILGYVKTGKKYGVSDNSIRKWIKFYETHN